MSTILNAHSEERGVREEEREEKEWERERERESQFLQTEKGRGAHGGKRVGEEESRDENSYFLLQYCYCLTTAHLFLIFSKKLAADWIGSGRQRDERAV